MTQPAQADPLVGTLSAVVGGPRGRHARGQISWLPPGAVMIALTTLTFAVGMLQKAPCATRGWDSSIRYTHLCASDLPGTYGAQGLDHPVLATYWAWATAHLARLVHDSATTYVIVNGVGFAALAIVAAWLLSRVRPDRPWEAAAFAVSPVLALSALVSWDLLAVAAVVGALWAYSREDLGLTGVAIGVGTAAGVYPALLLLALMVIAIRRRAWRMWIIVTVVAVVSWLVLNLPAIALRADGWRAFWSGLVHRGVGPGSLWNLLQDAAGSTIQPATLNLCSIILFIALCGGVVAVGLLAQREPTFAELGLLSVLAFLLVDKVYAPQYALWLLPLAVLARPRWRDQLIWQGAEVLFFCATAWNLAGLMSSGDGPAAMYDVTIGVRVLAELALAGAVVYRLLAVPWSQLMTVSSNDVVV